MIELPHRPTASQWIGLALVWLGGVAAIRFWFGLTALEHAIPGFSEIGLVAPLMFLASGTACVLLGPAHQRVLGARSRWVVRCCVVLLLAFPFLMLVENLAGVSLGVDFARAGVRPTPMNPFPGRMSPNACLGFGLSGLAIQLLMRPCTARRRRIALVLVFGLALIGAAGCIGYVLHLERLYRLGAANRLALPVAYGLTLLSVALWLLRERWIAEPHASFQRHEQRIGQRSFAVLGAVAVAAGVGGFAVIQQAYEQSQSEGLLLTATANADALANTMEVSAWFPRTVATRPVVARSLEELRARPDDPEHLDRLRRVGQDFLTAGVSGVRFENGAGAEVVTVGQLTVKPTDAALALSPALAGSKLVWKGNYILYSQHPVMAQGREIGRVTTEQPLPLFDKLIANIRQASDSSDVLVCNRVGDVASCVPSRFYAQPFTVPMLDANGKVNFPINRALLGQVGVLVTKDLRNIPVTAAYTPIGATGLGLVVKANAEATYAPLRDRLNILGLLLTGLVAAGWWVLRSQVRPLVAQIAAAQREVASSEKRQRAIADNLPVLISYISNECKLVFANQTFEQWMGLDPEQLKGRPVAALGTPIYHDRSDMLAAALAGQRVEYESLCDTLGTVRYLHTVLVPDVQPDGHVAGIYALSTDVSATKAAERHLHQLARVDALTGLPNRRQFEERLEQAMARSSRSKRPMALIFLDIDHFKAINDSEGHGAGDEVLKEFGVRLQGVIRVTDLAVRLAGDEFVVILEGLNTVDEASLVAEKLVEAIRRPMNIGGQTLPVTASMGLAYYEGRGGSAEALVERADRALYRAKSAGRNTFAATVV
jgi:diguanylate cyclase (GGDEF)-like protein/PAS domain S-box-containing protein